MSVSSKFVDSKSRASHTICLHWQHTTNKDSTIGGENHQRHCSFQTFKFAVLDKCTSLTTEPRSQPSVLVKRSDL